MKPRKDKPQEELFPFVEMEKLIPADHILRLIDRYVDFNERIPRSSAAG